MNETDKTFSQIPQLSHFNAVELSLIHLSHFPTLVSPGDGKSRASSDGSPPPSPSTQSLQSPGNVGALSTSNPALANTASSSLNVSTADAASHRTLLCCVHARVSGN
jgi:hypothetical protein